MEVYYLFDKEQKAQRTKELEIHSMDLTKNAFRIKDTTLARKTEYKTRKTRILKTLVENQKH